jgi:hypothetical protein
VAGVFVVPMVMRIGVAVHRVMRMCSGMVVAAGHSMFVSMAALIDVRCRLGRWSCCYCSVYLVRVRRMLVVFM